MPHHATIRLSRQPARVKAFSNLRTSLSLVFAYQHQKRLFSYRNVPSRRLTTPMSASSKLQTDANGSSMRSTVDQNILTCKQRPLEDANIDAPVPVLSLNPRTESYNVKVSKTKYLHLQTKRQWYDWTKVHIRTQSIMPLSVNSAPALGYSWHVQSLCLHVSASILLKVYMYRHHTAEDAATQYKHSGVQRVLQASSVCHLIT